MRPFVKAKVDFFSSERKEDHVHSLPELIDFNAVHNPDHLFCIQARSNAPFINVTNAQFKVAVDQCAQWIADNVKLPSVATKNGLAERPPVALLMESDFGLIVHQFALVSMGIPVCSSPCPPFSYSPYLRDLTVTAARPFRTPQSRGYFPSPKKYRSIFPCHLTENRTGHQGSLWERQAHRYSCRSAI